ncbi:hypothetical protein PILCRDRAFT_825358 [Piloderma croceum F 1598]|uniref:J domain-containing protein n=1 Tax=Piloderma croceum (strain F 1598) TaxID=765440 RepID=A0A0C3EXZ7_PILCF|nr:hypothetical protein PILCRDRAFT_825358 [Piloderma croceum F 1598]
MPLSKLKCAQLGFHFIPSHLRYAVQARLASTASSTPYSFPAHRHPKPHEIFHLPLGASQAEIKRRYIDLVRIHHPDSVLCGHVPPAERHARFQAISAAYDHLRGKSATIRSTPSYDDQLYEEIRWRARRTHNRRTDRPPETDYSADIVPFVFGGLLIFVAVVPAMASTPRASSRPASLNLAEARSEAQMYGQERRREIQRQAHIYQLAKEEEEECCKN